MLSEKADWIQPYIFLSEEDIWIGKIMTADNKLLNAEKPCLDTDSNICTYSKIKTCARTTYVDLHVVLVFLIFL